MEEKTRTLTGCKQCGRGYPYKELVNGLCKDCNMEEIEKLVDKLEDNIRWWKRAFETDGFESNEEGSYRRELENTKKELYTSIQQELDRAREEWTEELRQAFYDTFYKSGELWFDYLFEDGDTKAEQNAKEVVEEYWKEIISKLTTK